MATLEDLAALNEEQLLHLATMTDAELADLAALEPQPDPAVEGEVIEALAVINAELTRAQALIADGDGRRAKRLLAAIRADLEAIPGGDAGLAAEIDAAAGQADALPVRTRSFPNRATAARNATPSED